MPENPGICISGYILACLLCVLFVLLNGKPLQVTYGDTWIFTDLAKRIFFTHSLRMDAVFDLVYPPLYPALISTAYFFKSQAAIFNAILALNILVYSSAFFPIYFLFRDYAQLSRTQAWCGALLSVISLWPLRYVVHIASEPLYYPLAAWFAWLLVDGAYLRGKAELAVFIAVLTAFPLTKALGNMIFPSFMLFSGVIYYLAARPRPAKLITRPLLVITVSALVVYLYKKYQFSVLPQATDASGGYFYNLVHPNLLQLAYWVDRTRLDLSWLVRGTKTAAFPILVALAFWNRKLLSKDPLIIFTSLIFAGTFIVVPLFTPSDPMFREHPRYFIPFVFSFVVMLLKYHRLVTGKVLAAAALLTATGVGIGLPATFMQEPIRWQIGAYYCVWFGCLYFGRKKFVNVFLVLMCCTTFAALWGDRKRPSEADGSIASFYDQNGITEKILEMRKTYPGMAVLVDKTWKGGHLETWIEYERVMINMPFLPVFAEVNDSVTEKKGANAPALLLTNKFAGGGKKIVQGKYIALYLFDN